MIGRMLGAARLSSDTYEEVERDSSATIQALLVVIIVAIANAIGGILNGDTTLVGGLLFGVIRGIVFWAVWALLVLLIGTTILKSKSTEADWGQLARCTGFAQTPGILGILVFIPAVGGLIALLSFIWQIAAMVVAVRQSLDYTSTWRAFFVILIAAAIPLIIVIFLGIFFFSLVF
ncbi:MAG: YIP1 family protein [Dehalococcoidia bacterium]|nr:YIP1 family protein [Dehalococcoidia bacterium]